MTPIDGENPPTTTPVVSDFRNELRGIPDVELTNDSDADFRIAVSAIRADAGGKSPG
jgi:hypothetical protein